MNTKPRILAHRGGLLNAPENTIAAFELAFSNGAAGVECDIRKTRDGQFIAFHDRTAKRLTGHNWPIAATAYGQLKHLNVLGKAPIAHLDDILNLLILNPTRTCYFEQVLENPQDAAKLALEIKKAGVQRRAYILAFANKTEYLRAAKNAVPDIGAAVIPFLPSDILKTALASGAGAVCAGWSPGWTGTRELFKLGAKVFGLKEQIRTARAAGIEVSAGVANDYYDVRWLRSEGVSGIWTDDVPMAARVIYGG
ncbi:MAG: glycerophosphodiester phosphodiesterase [Elusimicrobia bacterium]|nr:glycerophosphodiester phosphodiesterase [Elusimicrobiota bacterium]